MADFTIEAEIKANIAGFTSKMDEVSTKLDKIGDHSKGAGAKTEKSFMGMKGGAADLAKGLLPVLGAAEGLKLAFDFAAEAFKKYGEHIKNVTDLQTSLSASGVKNSKEVTDDMVKFSEAMQAKTGISKEDTLQMAAQAASMGVQKDKIKETIEVQEGLTKALGGQKVPLRAIIAAQEGNSSLLKRYVPQLGSVKDAQAAYNMIVDKAKVGLKELSAEQTVGMGPMNQLTMAWGDMEEQVGGTLANALNPVLVTLKQYMPVVKDVINILMALLKDVIMNIINGLKILFYSLKAIADLLMGHFKDAWNDAKEAAKGYVTAVKSVINSAKEVGKAIGQAYVDGVKSGAAGIADAIPTLTASKVTYDAKSTRGTGTTHHATHIKKIHEHVEKIKHIKVKPIPVEVPEVVKIKAIMTEADAVMTAEGKKSIDILKKQASDLGEELKKVFKTKGQQSKEFAEVAAQLKNVNAELDKEVMAQKAAAEAAKQHSDAMKHLQDASTTAITAFATDLGKMATAKDGLKAMMRDMLGVVANFISAKGTAMVSMGVAEMIALDPAGPLDLAGGGALLAAAGVLKAAPLASGGIASGSAFVNVGEYSGAAHNPEVIAPLDKLKGMMGGGSQHHSFEISGDNLVSILSRTNNNTAFALGQ